jgi:RNA polymerase sigma-70 factor (ECF subfamily)
LNLFFPPDDLASEMSISTNEGVLASVESDAAATVGRIQEEFWVLQAQQGDEEAFGRLMDLFDRKLVYYLMRFTASREQALDIAQDVWISVFRGLRKLRNPSVFRAWLYQIAHAKVVSQVRKNVREEQILENFSAEQEESLSYEEPISGDPELVRSALSALSVEHREVLVLRYLENMSLEEMAHALQCRLGTIKSRLHYAKQALKQQINTETHHEKH